MRAVEVRPIASPDELLAAVAIRYAVFVQEQGVPLHEEVDARDPDAFHLVAWRGGEPVGTGRLVVEGDQGLIGRMAVLPGARGQGVGAALLEGLLAEARRRGLRHVHLHAQLHARGFYARFGFVASGPHFLDAGILHQRMDLELAP